MPSIYPLDSSDIETFTVVTNPVRTYTSSSVFGSTGSVHVYPRHSTIQKDVQPDSSFVNEAHDDADLSSLLRQVQLVGKWARYNRFSAGMFPRILDQYLAKCAKQPQALRLQEVLDPVRFSPPVDFNSNTLRKLVIKDQLNSFYRTTYPTAHWAYTNYNTLNFFTASSVPADSALLYPNIDGGDGGLVYHKGYVSGTYTPSGSFSFTFYINPRYTTDEYNGVFKAGTILHLSSTFALSLMSGSSKDVNGRPVGFRLQLQLSQSADVPPSLVGTDGVTRFLSGTYGNGGKPPTDLIFQSNDNILWLNHWHKVVVRWGTKDVNGGLGTFNVDGFDVGTFIIPSSSITPSLVDIFNLGAHVRGKIPGATQDEPTVLVLGNYYEGSNNSDNPLAGFFANQPALRDGLNNLWPIDGVETPGVYSFTHPLNAELHDVAIRRCYLSNDDIDASSSVGPTFLDNTFAFYVPPFFTDQAPYRQFVIDHGGILVTPFEEVNGATTQPFSVALSFGVGGHYINLENFVKDLAAESFPLLHHLTGVAIQTSTDAELCNEFLYAQPFVVKRNLTILPCDDGLFVPSFQLLVSEGLARAVDDLGVDELSFIHLDNMVMSSTLLFGGGAFDGPDVPADQANYFSNTQIGATPESPFQTAGPAMFNFINTVPSGSDVEAGAPLTIYQRTQDPSSNQITIFDISNMFYGFRISPGTLSFNEPDLMLSSMVRSAVLPSGSTNVGPIHITLADDGRGNIYRADCVTSQSTWNSVGNVYYDEGLVVVKSPHLYFYGFNQYSMMLRGEQHIHVMKLDAIAPNNQLNSSSNPNFQQVAPTGYPNDPEDGFVYVTNVLFHDSDLNVVMKTALAQPILKRAGDRIMFKVKYDF
jgi:hypothetical protein